MLELQKLDLGARTLLGAPGLTTRNKKLLGAPGRTTRSKNATRGFSVTTHPTRSTRRGPRLTRRWEAKAHVGMSDMVEHCSHGVNGGMLISRSDDGALLPLRSVCGPVCTRGWDRQRGEIKLCPAWAEIGSQNVS